MSGETKYSILDTIELDSNVWSNKSSSVSFPTYLLNEADEAEIYLEGSPADANIYLDNISVVVLEGWQEEANRNIDSLRKSDVTIFINVNANDDTERLTVDVEQKTHSFPFGTSVRSNRIAECFDAQEDDLYCGFVRKNYNWLVDSYK